jgi:hypothetical protein
LICSLNISGLTWRRSLLLEELVRRRRIKLDDELDGFTIKMRTIR